MLTSCGHDDVTNDSPAPKPDTPTPDTPKPDETTPISGMQSLKLLDMQVDVEVNLMAGITFASGVNLEKVEIEMDGTTTEIADPNRFVPQYPGICNIILTAKKNGSTIQEKAENLTIKPLGYAAMGITNIKPVEILPII